MDPLAVLNNDKATIEALKAFMILQLKGMAVDHVFNKKSIEGIAEARTLVDKMFTALTTKYDPPKKPVINSPR